MNKPENRLEDEVISVAILETYLKKLRDHTTVDVAIAGAGPSGLCAAYYLARNGIKTAIFERKLSIGGGMWGGGMMFNEIVVGPGGKEILEEFGVHTKRYREGYYTADAVETVTTIASKAMRAGTKIFNLIGIEDLLLMEERVCGFVINWSTVEMASLHVDPLTIRSRFAIEATGHQLEVLHTLVKKDRVRLDTPSGDIMGERSMWADIGEKEIVENTKEIYPGLYVVGMAANAAFGSPRMGPIFGGMLQSGKRAAEMIVERLGK